MRNICIILFCLLSVSSLFSQDEKISLDKVVGTIGGELVLKSEIEEQYSYLLEKNKGTLPPDAKCLISEQILTQKLLLNQAKLDSVLVSDEEVNTQVNAKIDNILAYMNNDVSQLEAYYGQTVQQLKDQVREDQKNQMLIQRMQSKIMGDVAVTPSEVKAFYNQMKVDSLPYFNAEVELGEIVYKPKVNEEQKKIARDKLEDIRKQLMDTNASFASLAENYSEDPGSARLGGDLGWAKRGKFVPEFEAAAFKLEKAEISPVIESDFGFHIIQLLERRGNSIHTRHILIKPKITEDDIALAKHRLDTIVGLLNKDSIDFSKAVKLYSDKNTQSYNNDGRMVNTASNNTFFEMSELDPEIFFVIDTMKIGRVSGAIQFTDPAGEIYFRAVKMMSRTTPHRASLKTDYQKFHNFVVEQKRNGIIYKWVLDKKKRTYIDIKDSELANCPNISKDWISTKPK